MDYTALRREALAAVSQASELCRTVPRDLALAGIQEKGDRSPVTVADFGAQAVVFHHLSRAFPAIPMVGEEDAAGLPWQVEQDTSSN